jgi:hypothetical protein
VLVNYEGSSWFKANNSSCPVVFLKRGNILNSLFGRDSTLFRVQRTAPKFAQTQALQDSPRRGLPAVLDFGWQCPRGVKRAAVVYWENTDFLDSDASLDAPLRLFLACFTGSD